MAKRKKKASERENIEGATIVKTATGRQYHIDVAPGEAAPYILLCGDPARAEKVSSRFDKIEYRRSNREYLTFTGIYRGVPISVMGTGIGCDNMEIAVIELLQCMPHATLIRIGSCGGLQPETGLGDLVISTGAVRLENTSTFFVPEGYPAIAHHEVVLALIEACKSLSVKFHLGITATASGFYGAQGRNIPGFPPRYPSLLDDLARIGVMNFEMETSTLLTLASLAKIRAGTVCAIYANRAHDSFIPADCKEKAELDCIHAGLAAAEWLYRLDKKREGQKSGHWLPFTSLD